MSKSVYIVLVNYNGMKYLDDFMDSMHKQTYTNYKIVFVDSASTSKASLLSRL